MQLGQPPAGHKPTVGSPLIFIGAVGTLSRKGEKQLSFVPLVLLEIFQSASMMLFRRQLHGSGLLSEELPSKSSRAVVDMKTADW